MTNTSGMNYDARLADAQSRHAQGMTQVQTTPEPEGQKFACGCRVRVADDLGPRMSHFTSGANATVRYTYAHAYGGRNTNGYCLGIDGQGESSWYEEWQLTAIGEQEDE